MSFLITLLPEAVLDVEDGESGTYGQIEIGKFRERFTSSLNYWTRDDYKRHWRKALDRIINYSNVSCLITSMGNPATTQFLYWWPMYRENDTVYFQNQMLFFDQLSSPFNENDPFSFVSKRELFNEDGEQISEWSISISELEAFLKEYL